MDVTPFQDPHGAAGKQLCAKIWTLGEAGRVSARPALAQALYRPDPLGPPAGLTLQHTPDGVIASWSPSTHQQIQSYDLTWFSGETCPSSPDAVSLLQRVSVLHPTTSVRVSLPAGTYCFAVWSRDRFDVVSSSAATSVFTIG